MMKRSVVPILTMAMGAVIVSAVLFASGAGQTGSDSLYSRLGGKERIAAIVDDLIPRLTNDPLFTKYFSGRSKESKSRIRKAIIGQVCGATGGPCKYSTEIGKRIYISDEQWVAGVNHLSAALEKLNVVQKERDDLMKIIENSKAEYVEVRGTH